ncbi:hypothetical protein GXM_08110 [Nostoc sphaeroides CCNUC1]|uniref:Uncharacterized protein n=1 Tax=Nostoc sphaeroides CCNUC1 TaxID=2653204 RepID=A0A5P8WEK9_9NOSO|nr:hypothetical protein GXM_08110 [Nostoc sphaeroides CCNUC1]
MVIQIVRGYIFFEQVLSGDKPTAWLRLPLTKKKSSKRCFSY